MDCPDMMPTETVGSSVKKAEVGNDRWVLSAFMVFCIVMRISWFHVQI